MKSADRAWASAQSSCLHCSLNLLLWVTATLQGAVVASLGSCPSQSFDSAEFSARVHLG